MRISHPAIASSVFDLVRVLEVDVRLGEDSWTSRIEIFKSLSEPDFYRARVSESEMFRLTPTFPQNENGEPEHRSDDTLFVERPFPHGPVALEGFRAESDQKAAEAVLLNLSAFLEHATGERPVLE
jgi:hypothetical protein